MTNRLGKQLRASLVTLVFGILFCAPAAANWLVPYATPYYTYSVQKDIVYGSAPVNGGSSLADLTLDLYIPDVPGAATTSPHKFPLMLMIHGGSFQTGSKTDAIVVSSAQEYAQRGWLVASINYRLQSSDPIPSSRLQPLIAHFGDISAQPQARAMFAAVDDTLTALDFLQARGDVIPYWTTLWGYSAGAVTALTTGYALDDHGIVRPPVKSVIALAGVLYTAIGNPFDDPLGSDPVLMVIHGTDDTTVPYSSATQIQLWANAVGLPLDFQPVAGAGHSLNVLSSNASTGVSLFQRSVDYLHETVFAGLQQGPQPDLPPGC